MYWITEQLDGRYRCEYRVQDGTERFHVGTLDEGVQRLIKVAPIVNGVPITVRDITVLREVAPCPTCGRQNPPELLPGSTGTCHSVGDRSRSVLPRKFRRRLIQ
jgi:hypothetical protein